MGRRLWGGTALTLVASRGADETLADRSRSDGFEGTKARRHEGTKGDGEATGESQGDHSESTWDAATGLGDPRGSVMAGDLVSVDVFVDDAVDLQGYQLHLGVTGGRSGSLELVDIAIADRRDHVYAGRNYWDAYNVSKSEMMAGMDSGAVAVKSGGYLATFTYRASADAAGTFVIDVLPYATGRTENRSLLFGPIMRGMVAIGGTTPAAIEVGRGMRELETRD